MSACKRVFSVGLSPGLDSMSPARSWRSASHAAGSYDWLSQNKLGDRSSGEADTICTVPPAPTPRLRHLNHTQAVSVWCIITVSSSLLLLSARHISVHIIIFFVT